MVSVEVTEEDVPDGMLKPLVEEASLRVEEVADGV